MGQNQDKLEGGEQALSEGLEETGPCPDSGSAGSHAGDVMEGGSSCEEEAGNTGENSGEPDAQDLDESPSQEPATPSTEKHINLRVSPFTAREVRQGGAAGKEGGGEGGRTAPLVPQETSKNQKSRAKIEERARTYKLFNQIKTERKTSELRTSSKIKMELQDDGTLPHEEIEDENFSVDAEYEEGSVMGKISRFETHAAANDDLIRGAGSEFLHFVQHDQNETMMAEVGNEDIKLYPGTAGHLSERKEPPTAQSQHPLKNSLQKEALLDMSDTIHCRAPKERRENNTKEETFTREVKPALNDFSSAKPKVNDTDEQRKSNQKPSDSASDPAPPAEPSSILEKLLRRNKKEATPALSKVKEVKTETTDAPVEMNAATGKTDKEKRILPSLSASKEKSTKYHRGKDLDMKHTADSMTSDVLCFQPGVTGSTMCESSTTKSHYCITDCQNSERNSTDASVNKEMEIMPNIGPSKNLSSDNLQSAVSHERTSCEVSGMISEESASFSVPPIKSDGQIADSCHLLTGDKTGRSSVWPPLQIKGASESKTDPQFRGPEKSDVQSKIKKKVRDFIDATAARDVDASSVLVAARTVSSEESLQMTESMTQNQPDKKPGKERDDGVTMREKSPSTPKSRPVSDLIRETIQMHEKLQHQDRSKPQEVKVDEGQSVKVAQMKAAFDSAQKSPDKAIERKPSVRKGKDIKI